MLSPSLTTQNPSPSVIAAYQQWIADGKLLPDAAQQSIAHKLDILAAQVKELHGKHKKRSRLFAKAEKAATGGVYLWGSVGRGKSMLMDMFFAACDISHKRRIHFHAFMLEVHARIHRMRQKGNSDPLAEVAEEIATETHLLCLDELQVTDVADATILRRLFGVFLDHGMVVVFTSNRPPESLYLGGLQRELFLKFITLVNERMEVVELASPEDYRLKQMRSLEKTFLTPLNATTHAQLEEMFSFLASGHAPQSKEIEVQGRKVTVPRFYRDIALFSFDELCAKPLWAADYIALCKLFRTLMIAGIPELSPEKRNEAKRFVTLIDAMYEHKVKLICTAAAPPETLYTEGDGSFEFQRTISRLIEMQSAPYIAASHLIPAHVNLHYDPPS